MTIEATFTDTSTLSASTPKTVFNIPGISTLLRLDGTTEVSDNLAETAQFSQKFVYYDLPAFSDQKPIILWSTGETNALTLPTGYSWGYFMEVSIHGTTLETNSGSLTLEVHDADRFGMENLSDNITATMEYSSLNDLGKLYTNPAFICPIDLFEEVDGTKIAYRMYLQRILLDDKGKYNGIGAGAFQKIRYQP